MKKIISVFLILLFSGCGVKNVVKDEDTKTKKDIISKYFECIYKDAKDSANPEKVRLKLTLDPDWTTEHKEAHIFLHIYKHKLINCQEIL